MKRSTSHDIIGFGGSGFGISGGQLEWRLSCIDVGDGSFVKRGYPFSHLVV